MINCAISQTYSRAAQKPSISLTLKYPRVFIYGFLGPNGAGKTTTIRIMTGAIAADSGSVLIDGIDLDKSPIEAKQRFGLVPDTPDLFSKLRAYEYLNFVADVYRVPTAARISVIENLAARFELSDVLKSPISSMSRGMRMKLNLIASLVHSPHNWILDEPIVGLDPHSAFALKELMREHTPRRHCLLSSTSWKWPSGFCDELASSQGKLIFTGNLEAWELRESAPKPGSETGDENLEASSSSRQGQGGSNYDSATVAIMALLP